AIHLYQGFVGKSRLRILVQHFRVRSRRRGVEVEIIFLHVLPVISLRGRNAEETFLEEGIFYVPHRYGGTEATSLVAKSRDAILAPAVRARAGVIVTEIIP